MIKTVAALFIDPAGEYAGIPGVELWGEDRDARLYRGSRPVVAHPPCARWCRLAGLVEARWGHRRGEDGGCFSSALANIQRVGGVLEHPAYSTAWDAHGLNVPPTGFRGWVSASIWGGWTCYVEQWRYGHEARKATWLLAYGLDLPAMRWGHVTDQRCGALVSWCGNKTKADEKRPRLGKKAALSTPPAFRDALLAMARTGQ